MTRLHGSSRDCVKFTFRAKRTALAGVETFGRSGARLHCPNVCEKLVNVSAEFRRLLRQDPRDVEDFGRG